MRFALLLLMACQPSTASQPAAGFSKSSVYSTQGFKVMSSDFGSVSFVSAACAHAEDILLAGTCEIDDLEDIVGYTLVTAGAYGTTTATDGLAYWRCEWQNIGWDGYGDIVARAQAHCVLP